MTVTHLYKKKFRVNSWNYELTPPNSSPEVTVEIRIYNYETGFGGFIFYRFLGVCVHGSP